MQRDGFWIGCGAKDFISHKVHSGRALPFHCYFLSVTERKIFFFFSKSHVQLSVVPLLSCSTVPAMHKLCHCSTVQLFQYICTLAHFLRLHTLLHTWTFTHLHILAHLHTFYTYTHFCTLEHSTLDHIFYSFLHAILQTCTLLHTCTFLHICILFTLAHTFAHLHI